MKEISPRPIGSSGPDLHNGLGPVSFGTTVQYRLGSIFLHLDQNWASSGPDVDFYMVIWPICGPDLGRFHTGSGLVKSRIWSSNNLDLGQYHTGSGPVPCQIWAS
ncbi:hypothetical protein M9458_056971 [Cirrhinus mrigala]|uniref:Uncharacterized protein n=1 Tax=Cirrhinus mrigala TaxID=683832 RepID=A0ABD0MG51_CIRMR